VLKEEEEGVGEREGGWERGKGALRLRHDVVWCGVMMWCGVVWCHDVVW